MPSMPLDRVSEFGSPIKRTQPVHLTPMHKTIIALKATGLKRWEIAEVLNVDRATVTNVCKHPDLQELLARLTSDHVAQVRGDVTESIGATAMEAFLKTRGLMRDAKSETVQMNCAFDIMDRAGFKPKDAAPQVNVHLGDTGALMVRALREVRQPANELPQLQSSKGVFEGVDDDT